MKTKPKSVIRAVPIREVVVSKGRKRAARGLDELIDSIKNVGLINPITVTKDLVLVAGLHRLQACEFLGWKEIPATVLSVSQLEAELAEIDENLCRIELTALERAEQTTRRKQIYEARFPETRRGHAGVIASNRKQGKGHDATATVAVASFANDTATRTGKSSRSVHGDIQVGEHVAPEVRDAIRETPLADRKRELIELAQVDDPSQQAQIADLVVSGKAKTVAEAKEQLVASAGAGVVRDELGQEITDPAIAEAFTILRRRLLEVATYLRAGTRKWGSFNEEQEQAKRVRILCAKGYSYLRLNIERDLKQLAYSIVASAPYTVCPYCKGAPLVKDRAKWCEGCRGGGWVTKSSYESAPPETKVQIKEEVSHGS